MALFGQGLSAPGASAALGGGGALLGAGLANMFGDWQNPADQASKTIGNIPDMMKGYYQNYINAGNQALPQLQQQYGNLINNPGGQLNQMGQGFQQSPGFQFALKQALMGSGNAAAAGGMAGSPQHEQQNMGIATGMANQDYYNWLDHAQGLYGQGLQGLGGIAQMGYGASTDLGQSIANAMLQQANLQYAGAQNQNEHDQGGLGSIFGGLGSLGALAAFGG